jgi:hypothetical protein
VRNGSTWRADIALAFGKQQHGIAASHVRPDFARGATGIRAARAIDEDRLLQAGHESDEEPFAYLALGDERDVGDRPQGDDVRPRDVVGNEQRRASRGRLADDGDPHAQEDAAQPMEQSRQDLPVRQVQLHDHGLGRHDHQHDRHIDEHEEQRAKDHSERPPLPGSGTA